MSNRFISFFEKYSKPMAAAAALTSTFLAAPAAANPSGPSVQSGAVNITGGVGSMTVHQFTERAIVNWQKFGIGVGESVRFMQPNQLSVILNRVIGQDPTKILGQMNANGNVWIINPNGVLFGPQSQVNVGGLVASTLNISNEDFLNGNYRFTQDQNKALASVVNQGSITVTDGGYAVLMAPLVSNEGMIVANLGQVNLMSGESATLNFDGRNLISYDIGHMKNANPGTVVVDRRTVSTLLANVIQDPNLTEAGSLVENADGSVSLVSAADTVVNSGTIQANGKDGEKAGKIVLDSGRLTVVGEGSTLEASGKGANSDGGEIVALSRGTMKFEDATIEARGGNISGDGGFIDTSGLEHILLEGYADAGAVNGESGTWLIDPEFLTIISGTGGSLDGNTDTTGLGGVTDTISESYLEGLTAGTDVILQADNQINIEDLADDLLNFADGVSVTFLTSTGDIIFDSGGDTVRVGGDGNISFDAGGDLYLATVVNEGTGTVDIAYDGNIIDQNGTGTTNIVGDIVSFDVTQSDLEFDSGDAVEVTGFTNSAPAQINLTVGDGRVVNLVSNLTDNLDVDATGAVTSDALQTELNIAKTGSLTLNGLQTSELNITATGDVNGGTGATDLAADNAVILVDGAVIGLDTDVAVLDVGTTGTGTIDFNTTDGTLTDLTVRTSGGDVTVDSASVLTGGLFSYSDGTTANTFSLIDSSGNELEISTGISGSSISLEATGSILNTAGNVIQADAVALKTTGAFTSVGDFLTPAPILVQGDTRSEVDLSVSVAGGEVNIEHTDADPSFVNYNDPTQLESYLLVDDPNGDSFGSFSFERNNAGDLVVGQVGSSTDPLNEVTLAAADGSVLESTFTFSPADVNVFGETLNVTADGGTVDLDTDVSLLTALGDNILVDNDGDLETFNLTIDSSSFSVVTADNGGIRATPGVLGTLSPVTDIGTGGAEGDTDGDGYNVTVDITVTDGDIAFDTTTINGSDGPGTGSQGVLGDSLIRVTTLNGDFNPGGGMLTVGGDTDVELIAESGGIGTISELDIITDTPSGGERLLLDASQDAIDVNISGGQFDTVTVQHDDVMVNLTGTSGTIDSTGLSITGRSGVSTINYTNRTAGHDLGVINTSDTDINIDVAGDLGSAGTFDAFDDIVLSTGEMVTVDATGSVFLDVLGSAMSSVELGTIGGNASVRALGILELNLSGTASVAGDFLLVAPIDTTLGSLVVGGDAVIEIGATVTNDDAGGATDLVASSLTILTTNDPTDLNLDTDVETLTITDPFGNSNLVVNNLDSLDALTANTSTSTTTFDVETTNTLGNLVLNNSTLSTTISGVDLGTFTLSDGGTLGIRVDETTLDHARMTDVNINANTIESGGGILTTLGNATLQAGSVGTDTDALELQVDQLSVFTTDTSSAGVFIDQTVGALTIDGIETVGDICVDVAGDLRLNDDVESTGSGDIYLRSGGSITVGNDAAATGTDADQILTGSNSTVVLDAAVDIVDNNGTGNAAVVSGSGEVVLLAGGSAGTVQFNPGSTPTGTALEVDAETVAADAGGDINLADLNSDGDDFTSGSVMFDDKDGVSTTISGITAGEDISLEVEDGSFLVINDVTATTGSVAIAASSAGESILIFGVASADDTISLVAGDRIVGMSGSSVVAPNVVADADEIFSLTVEAENLAVNALTFAEVFASNPSGDDVRVSELTSLQSGDTVTGFSTGSGILLVNDNLQVQEDVTFTGNVGILIATEDIVIGNDSAAVGAASDIVSGDAVGLAAGGDIVDNNGLGSAAVAVSDSLLLDADGSVVGSSGEGFEIDTRVLAAQAGTAGELDLVELDSGGDGIGTSESSVTVNGIPVAVRGLEAGLDVSLDVLNGDISVSAPVTSTSGSVALRTRDEDANGGDIRFSVNGVTAATSVSLESAGSIDTSSNFITATNVVLDATTGIDANVQAANLAARNTSGTIDITALNPTDSVVTVSEVDTILGANTITGIQGAEDVCLLVATQELLVNEDIVGGTAGAASEVALQSGLDLTISAQVRNATSDSANLVTLSSTDGDLVDSNGDGVAAVNANGGGVSISAPNGALGAVDFGTGTFNTFEIDAQQVAAFAFDSINVLDLDTNADGLEVAELTSTKTSNTVTGLFTNGDIAVDVVNGDLDVNEVVTSLGSVGLRTRDTDDATDGVNDGDVSLNAPVFATLDTLSVEASGAISGSQMVGADIMVLSAEEGIELDFFGDQLAAESTVSGNVDLSFFSTILTVSGFDTLLGGGTVAGVSSTGDVSLDGGSGATGIAIEADVVGGTSGVASEIEVISDLTLSIGDGTDGQIRNATTDSSNLISLFAPAEITDDNASGVAALDANGGDVVISVLGSVGATDFAGSSTTFEIDANRLAVEAFGDINILDLDSNSDGLDITTLALADGVTTITGAFSLDDLCIEVLNSDLNVLSDVSAVRTALATSGGGDITVGALVTGIDLVSLESSGRILDASPAATDSVVGLNVVLDSVDGIGDNGVALDVFASSLAARSTAGGDVNLRFDGLAPIFTTTLTTLKGSSAVTGISTAGDLCLELVDGDFELFGNLSADNIALRTVDTDNSGDGDIAIAGLIDANTTVSVESSQGILDNSTTDSDRLEGTNVVLTATESIEIDVYADNLAAQTTSGDIEIDAQGANGDVVNVASVNTLKGGVTVDGIDADGNVSLEVVGDDSLQLNADIVGGSGGAASEIDLQADIDITIAAGQARSATADSGNLISVSATGGDITDTNGDNLAAFDANGGDLVMFSGGTIGSVDFAGNSSPVEVNAARVAGTAIDDLNLLDLDIDTNGLEVTTLDLADGLGTMIGLSALNDLNVEVTDGELLVEEAAIGTNVSLVTRNGDITVDGLVQALTTSSLEAAGAIGGTGTISGTNIVLDAETGIVADLEAGNVAVRNTVSGDIELSIFDLSLPDVLVTELTTLDGGAVVTGIVGVEDICLDLRNAQPLDIDEDIVAGTGGEASTIAIRAFDDITINGQVRNATADSGNLISIEANSGDLRDRNGDNLAAVDANGGDVVFWTPSGQIGDPGFGGTEEVFEINANRLAANSSTELYITDLDLNADGLEVTSLELVKAGFTLTGVRTNDDLRLEVVNGDLTLGSEVLAFLDSAALRTLDADDATDGVDDGDIFVNAPLTSTFFTVSVEAAGAISGSQLATGADVVLQAEDGIELSVAADNLAAESTSSGNVDLTVTGSNVTVDELTTLIGGDTVTGITAAENVVLDGAAAGAGITINDDVVAGTSGVASEIELVSGLLITIGDGTDGQIRNATTDTANLISLFAPGAITDNNADGLAALEANGGDVVISALGGVGSTDFAGTATLFEVDANRLAVESFGDINILDLDSNSDGLDITTLALAGGVTTITGAFSLDDLCIEVLNSDLNVLSDVSGTRIALATSGGGDITVGALVNGIDLVSLESSGRILDASAAATDSVIGSSVVLDSVDGIGSDGVALDVFADNLAARSTAGEEINLRFTGTVPTFATLTTLKGGSSVVGVATTGDLCLELVDGDFLVASDLSAENIAIRTVDTDNSGDGDITIAALVDANTTVSVESAQGILDNSTSDADRVEGTNVVLSAESGIEVDVYADNLAARTSSGDISLVAQGSNGAVVTVGSVETKDSVTVVGVTGNEDVIIDVSLGSLDIEEDVTAGDEVALRASDNIILGDDTSGLVTAATTATIAALNGDITDGNTGTNVSAQSLVMTAAGGIGDGDEIETDVTNFAADAGGHIFISEADSLNITLVEDLLLGITANGITGDDVCVDVLAGDLNVLEDITAGNDVTLRAGGNILLGEDGGAGGTSGVVRADILGGTIGLVALGGSITDGNTDLNLEAVRLMMTARGGIGSDAAGGADDALEIDISNVAASAGTGDVNVLELDAAYNDGLQIANIVERLKSVQAIGVSAGMDVSIEVVDGDLNIFENITADTGGVTLRTQQASGNSGNGDIIFGDDADDVVTAATVASVDAAGDAVDNNTADVTAIVATEVVFVADDVAAINDTDAFEIEAETLSAAINSGVAAGAGSGNVLIDDLSGDLRIIENDTLNSSVTVTGVTAAGDICIDVEDGNLSIDEDMTAGHEVHLRASGDVLLGDDGVDNGEGTTRGIISGGANPADVGFVGIEAGGSITDEQDDAADTTINIIANIGGTGGSRIGLVAGGGIGSDATGGTDNGIEMDTVNLAAIAGTGDVNVVEQRRALILGRATTGKGLINVIGVTAGLDVSLDVQEGDLRVNEDINAINGEVALRTQDTDANGDGDIIFGNGLAPNQTAADTVTAGGTVSVESVADVVDNNGTGNATIITPGSLVITAQDIASVNDTEAFEINASAVAASINTGGNGNIFLEDLTGDLTIGAAETIEAGVTVNGLTAGNDISVDVLAGNLNVSEDVMTVNDLTLQANGSVVLGEDTGNTTGAMSGTSVTVTATNGNITDGNSGVNVIATSLITTAGGGVGSDENGDNQDDIETDVTNFAATAGTGDVNITELDTTTLDGLSLAGTGVQAQLDICIDVVDGTLMVSSDVTAGTDVALRAQDANIEFNNDSVVTATNGKVSIDVADSIVDNNNQADAGATLVANTNVVINSGNSIGVVGTPLQIEAAGLAAASGVEINVADLSGNLQIVEDTTLKGNVAIDGVTAQNDICIDVLNGDLDVTQQVASTDGNVALQATGSVTLSGTEDVAANRTSGTVSVEAGTEVVDNNTGSFTGQNVVFESTTGVGNASTVTIEADNFAAAGGTGRVDIQDTAGGATIAELQALKGGDTINGVTAAQDVCIDIVGGDLVIDEVVNAGTVVALKADGNIASNATTTAVNKVSVESTAGGVSDGNGPDNNFVANQVVLRADGNIGGKAEAVDIDSSVMAAQSTAGEVNLNEATGNMVVGDLALEKNGGTVSDLTAGTDIGLTADDGTVEYNGRTIEAADQIVIRTRDTLVTNGTLKTDQAGKVSIEVTNGSIEDGGSESERDIISGDAVLKANGSIGNRFNPIELDVNLLAAESETGSVAINERDGLVITDLNLSQGGGTVEGITAAQDVDVDVEKGSLDLNTIRAGDDVRITVRDGDITDGNGAENNITADGNVSLNASNCVEDIEITAGGIVVIADKRLQINPIENTDTVSTPFVPLSLIVEVLPDFVLPPGVFAQDNVKLGEKGLYLEVLHGYLRPEEIQLIISRLEAKAN